MLETLELTEGGPAQTADLTKAEYRALAALGFVALTPTLEPGRITVSAAGKVGAVTIGDRQILVRPKIANLNCFLFLVGFAQNPQIWRDEPIRLEAADELLPAVADSFARITTRVLENGLIAGYVTITDTLPVLRGRVLAGQQISRHFGLQTPLALEYDEFTVDIAENQLLAMSAARLLMLPRLSDSARKLLQRLRHTLSDVTALPRGAPTPRWTPSRLNARYNAALRLADIILAARSFDHRSGDLTVTGYMFDMWKVYEDFVTAALGESLEARGWLCGAQVPMYLDEGQKVGMRPDLLGYRGGSPVAVVDAKYKAVKIEGFPNSDLYQMLAYCTVLGLREGHLVYAKGNEPVSIHTVQRAGTTIHCHVIDLALGPTELLRQVDVLADRITGVSERTERW